MLKPRTVGWLVLLIVLMVRGLDALMGAVGALVGGPALLGWFEMLGILFVVLYMAGAMGLILWRRWGSALLVLAGIGEIVARLTRAALLLGGTPGPSGEEDPFLFVSNLIGLILPGAIAATSWWLRRHPEAWPALSAPQRPRWLRRLTWASLGTGLLLPALTGLAVSLVQAARDEPVVYLSEGAGWAGYATACFAGPFLILAFLGYITFREALSLHDTVLARRLFLFAGAFAGTTLAVAVNLFGFLYAWNIESLEALLLMLLPVVPFSVAVPGALAGCFAGWVCFRFWRRTGHGGPALPAEAGAR